MLIPFNYLWRKYEINAKGVLHIGANSGQEAAQYYLHGVERTIWIEAIPSVFEELKANVLPYPNALCFCECISNVDGEEKIFHISSNKGESSSYLELGTHAIMHPEVKYIQDLRLLSKRIDTLFSENNLTIEDYPFLNIDLQCAEMDALIGMGHLLSKIKWAYLEINKEELYRGCPMVEDIDAYLRNYGLIRVETSWAGATGWGDGFFVKK